jgi:hypothetical protein
MKLTKRQLHKRQIQEFWSGTALIVIGCCLLLAACQGISSGIVAEPEPIPVEMLPDGDLRDHLVMKQYMMEMTTEVRESIAGAFCIAGEEHYGKYCDSTGKMHGLAGHCHGYNRVICLTPKTVKEWPDVIDHEGTHAYHFRLRVKGSDFDKKWRPGCGITWYALDAQKTTGDFMEDVAEWVEELKKCVRGKPSVFDGFTWTDTYRHNLHLLLEYKFVREQEFREFLKKNPGVRKP